MNCEWRRSVTETKRGGRRALGTLFSCLLVLLLGACASTTKEETTVAEAKHVHHTIDYIEFSVTDMGEAQRFFAAAFDWSFTDYGPDYAGIRRGEGEAGGLSVVDEVSTGGPLVVLFSEDLDDSVARVLKAGGRITKEPFEFPGGKRFQFLDPSGNELAVWAF